MAVAGGGGKTQQDVESGLGESFTSADSKLGGDAAVPSPIGPEEVKRVCHTEVIHPMAAT